jgi:hypothetical protein
LSQSNILTCRFSAEWSVDAPIPGLRNLRGSSRTSSSDCSFVSWIGLWGGVKCPDAGGVRPRPLDTAHQLRIALKRVRHTTTANDGNSKRSARPRFGQESLNPTPSPLISESAAILPFTIISINSSVSKTKEGHKETYSIPSFSLLFTVASNITFLVLSPASNPHGVSKASIHSARRARRTNGRSGPRNII